jgi:hypothetical protein
MQSEEKNQLVQQVYFLKGKGSSLSLTAKILTNGEKN